MLRLAPYTWPGLNNSWLGAGASHSWRAQVTNACNDIKNNYQAVVHSIAIFIEPEHELTDANCLTIRTSRERLSRNE